MRTTEEIAARIRATREDDWIGTIVNDLIGYLPFDIAKEWLKPEVTAEEWKVETPTHESVKAVLIDYLPFALGKAIDHRGLSAGRSIEHFQTWLWLLGDDELLAFAEEDLNYAQYGAPILKAIAEKYGFEHEVLKDEGFLRMAQGKRCGAGYDCGCGR